MFHVMMELRTYIRDNDMTVQAFADRLGVTRQTVGRWMSGRAMPRRSQLRRIAEMTGGTVTADTFLAVAPNAGEAA